MHVPMDSIDGIRRKNWLEAGSKGNVNVNELVHSRQMEMNIPMLSTNQQTSDLEACHSVINHFAPKMIGFLYPGQQSRLLLVDLIFNEMEVEVLPHKKMENHNIKLLFPKIKMESSLKEK
ncbi:hypothetical protein KUTeg_014387 [Tegillarca granosa]|uniref:Uncharacterized protein n=1 Tax=Tegillarca granosa TaxID=220873 RepID=A0ABQ9EWI8_TEGGR|nr:hypothetical protein KUTeg_014387 [Tegillarca granosa]